MKRFVVVFMCVALWSCEFFQTKKVSTNTIVEQELQSINWTDVDTYPSFAVCDSIAEKNAQKQCFETTILQHVNEVLGSQEFMVTEHIDETVVVTFQINNQGSITVTEIKKSPVIDSVLPDLDSTLRLSMVTLPRVYPAIKRGQQVSTSFSLPVVIVVE